MYLDDFFDEVEAHFNRSLPFVTYRKPKTNKVSALLQETNEVFESNDFEESGFIFSPFDASNSSILIPFEHSKSIEVTYKVEDKTQLNQELFNQPFDEEKASYINNIKSAISLIDNGSCSKIVLSRKEKVNNDKSPLVLFKSLLNLYKNAFVYCWYHPNIGLWLGATPETLLELKGKRLITMALAGTQTQSKDSEIQWTAKEFQEQQYVTDFIVKNLNEFTSTINVSDVKTIGAGHIAHLKTDILGQIEEDVSLKQIIEALHPTPAVCGLPRTISKEFILKHENYNRGFYTGFLGLINKDVTIAPKSRKTNIENRAYEIKQKQSELFVNLRCMQLKNQEAIIYIGGGITEDSNPEDEWDETVSKSLVMKRILNT